MSLYQSLTDIPHLVEHQIAGSRACSQRLLAPLCYLLLDELEKAHHDLLNIFLTIFDEGYFVNGSGHELIVSILLSPHQTSTISSRYFHQIY